MTNCTFNYTISHSCDLSGRFHQANTAGKQLLHHALFDLTGFGESGFKGRDLGVDVG